MHSLKPTTKKIISRVFAQLDYHSLGKIYCDEGGDIFWEKRKGPCQKLGIKTAAQLKSHLPKEGHSLYIGAGVAELPMLILETVELQRSVFVHNLRKDEVSILNKACSNLPFKFRENTAAHAQGHFNHIWLVSVLNDPECYPETSALSYGRATPLTFNPSLFKKERDALQQLIDSCFSKLSLPGIITTSVEEISWVKAWCLKRGFRFRIESKTYPTPIVADPLCFIHIEETPPSKLPNPT